MAQPECELVGTTTVTGEPQKRAMLASALCTGVSWRDRTVQALAGQANRTVQWTLVSAMGRQDP